ncbi:hypothetical protein E2C01_000294 [Portunus trituberculatus]|uniref:Uncharacterized protein n=1 Tax=Portunus trituberculatus TaxID=210409 RepID=A0A5B7CER8_PORTR|nr:hypothetical protein [Portunus trituberculatus]
MQEENEESNDNKKGLLQHEDRRELVVESEILDVTFHQVVLCDRDDRTTHCVQVGVVDSVRKAFHWESDISDSIKSTPVQYNLLKSNVTNSLWQDDVAVVLPLVIIARERSLESGTGVKDVKSLLHSNVPPVRHLNGPLQLADHQESCTHHSEAGHTFIGTISDGGVSVGGGLEAGVRLNIWGGKGDSGGLRGGGVGGEHVVVASVAHQLLLPLLDVGRVWLQQLCHDHFHLHLWKAGLLTSSVKDTPGYTCQDGYCVMPHNTPIRIPKEQEFSLQILLLQIPFI